MNTENPPATILIVDDHAAVLAALRNWVNAEFPSCRLLTATSAEEAITSALAERPTIVLMDVGLPGLNGIEATARIKADLPDTQVVILSIHEDAAFQEAAAAANAAAYMPKRTMYAQLMPLLRSLLAGPAK